MPDIATRIAITGLILMQLPLLIGIAGPQTIVYQTGLVLLAGGLLWIACSGKIPERLPLSRRTFLSLLGLFTVCWALLALIRFKTGHYSVFDTGIYAQIIEGIRGGNGMWSGVHERHALSNHFTPAALLFVPLFSIKPTLLWLPMAKVLAWAAGAVVLERFGRSLFGERSWLAWALPVLWITHRFGTAMLFTEFQFSSLTPPLIFLAFLLLRKGKLPAALCLFVLLFAFRENLALVLVSAGIYQAFFIEKRRQGLFMCLVGIALGGVLYFVVMPSLAPAGEFSHVERLAPLALLWEKAQLLFFSLLSVAFLPIFSPLSLLLLLPVYALPLLSGDPQMLSHNFHYHDIALPVLFIATAHGLLAFSSRFKDGSSKIGWRVVAVALILLLVRYHNRYPMHYIRSEMGKEYSSNLHGEVRELARNIPTEATLFVPNEGGAYFFKFPNMRLSRPDDRRWCNTGMFVVTSIGKKTWPYEKSVYLAHVRQLKSNDGTGTGKEALHRR